MGAVPHASSGHRDGDEAVPKAPGGVGAQLPALLRSSESDLQVCEGLPGDARSPGAWGRPAGIGGGVEEGPLRSGTGRCGSSFVQAGAGGCLWLGPPHSPPATSQPRGQRQPQTLGPSPRPDSQSVGEEVTCPALVGVGGRARLTPRPRPTGPDAAPSVAGAAAARPAPEPAVTQIFWAS